MTLYDLYLKLEDNNDHGLCAILCAIAGRVPNVIRPLVEIVEQHLATGLTYGMSQRRYELSQPHYLAVVNGGDTVASVTTEDKRLGAILAAIVKRDYRETIRLGKGI